MMLVFFDCKGSIYSHIVPEGSPVNGKYIVKAIDNFLKQLKNKRPGMVEQEWWFHWDNVPVHISAVIQQWFAAHSIQQLEHPPCSVSRWRPQKVDKRMYLDYTHGLFIT